MAPSTMRAARIEQLGGSDVVKLAEVPVPEPRKGQVRIRVEAVGLNYSDIMIREGRYIDRVPLPYVMGRELAGTIDALGEGVAGLPIGTRVVATLPGGALAEYAVAPAAGLVPCPEGFSPEQGASFLIQGITAIHCLDLVALQPGQTVLIHAAAGGVGTLAVQIARSRGLRVLGTASSAEKLRTIEELGGTAIDYTRDDWVSRVLAATEGRGAAAILESVGGDVLVRSFREALAVFGHLVIFGCASGDVRKLSAIEILESNRTISGYYLGSFFPDHWDRVAAATAELLRLIGEGTVRPLVGRVFPLDETAAALDHLQNRQSVGKVVVKL